MLNLHRVFQHHFFIGNTLEYVCVSKRRSGLLIIDEFSRPNESLLSESNCVVFFSTSVISDKYSPFIIIFGKR